MVKECLVVKLLLGTSRETSEVFLVRLVVNARDNEVDIFAEFPEGGLSL